MWSFACILPELRYGNALITGRSEADQLCAITEVIGPPPSPMLLKTKKTEKLGIDSNGVLDYTMRKTGKPRKPCSRNLSKVVPSRSDVMFRDFLSVCLTWDPSDRPTPKEAMSHGYFTFGC